MKEKRAAGFTDEKRIRLIELLLLIATILVALDLKEEQTALTALYIVFIVCALTYWVVIQANLSRGYANFFAWMLSLAFALSSSLSLNIANRLVDSQSGGFFDFLAVIYFVGVILLIGSALTKFKKDS